MNTFPKSLDKAWRESNLFPTKFPNELEYDFDGTAFQHLFSGMTCFVFKKINKAVKHFQIAVEKDEESMSCCTEMGIFHRLSTNIF